MGNGRNWYTADTHFGSDAKDILFREMRPFASTAEFIRETARIWNGQVSQDDVIYVIGDFCNYNSYEKDYESGLAVSQLIHAHIILLTGNSEERVIQAHFDGDFARFREYCLEGTRFNFDDVRRNTYVSACGEKFFLTHRPSDHDPHCLNLFGHTHRAYGLWRPYGFNMGVDLNHFRLFNDDDIMHLLSQKNDYWDQDPDNC